MEIGAIKNSLNNEIIRLKKNLNQAKIQLIHKLTRKAKQLKERKNVQDNLRDKLAKKAETVVAEVLIMKKVVAKELVRFMLEHKEPLSKYINQAAVTKEKVYAKLIQHKALAAKYDFIRQKFKYLKAEELFLTKKEKLQLKKEEQEKKKEWKVENINKEEAALDDNSKHKKKLKNLTEVQNTELFDEHIDNDVSNIEINLSDNSTKQKQQKRKSKSVSESEESANETETEEQESDAEIALSTHELKQNNKSVIENNVYNESSENEEISDDEENNIEYEYLKTDQQGMDEKSDDEREEEMAKKVLNKPERTPKEKKKQVENKTTKQKHELPKLARNILKKVELEKQSFTNPPKIVDPFFVTESGENYLTLAEPRLPDIVKAEHSRGNRQVRRAKMFGRKIPKQKSNFENKSFGSFNKGIATNKYEKFNNAPHSNAKKQSTVERKFDQSLKRSKPEIEEKLHPSWEAKKQKSGILPFQGKKVVFD